jgi:nitrate reductase NapD
MAAGLTSSENYLVTSICFFKYTASALSERMKPIAPILTWIKEGLCYASIIWRVDLLRMSENQTLGFRTTEREKEVMNMSGILVVAMPERCEEVAEALAALPGVEVHQKDPANGKIIVVQEASTIANEADGARAMQAVPGVISVNMVYHYFADDPTLGASSVPDSTVSASTSH